MLKLLCFLLLHHLAKGYPKLPCLTSDGSCPENLECKIKEPKDCNNGEFRLNATDCSCCAGCIKFLGRGEQCRHVDIPPLHECGRDLVCSERTGTCVPPTAETPLVEDALFMSKQSSRSNITCLQAVKDNPRNPPKCTKDGTYYPKQCFGEFCFCVTINGNPIPRYKIAAKRADSMNCVCARVELEKNNGRMCDEFGNYKLS